MTAFSIRSINAPILRKDIQFPMEGVKVEEPTAKASRVFRSQTVAFKRLPYGLYSSKVIGSKRDSTYKRVADAWEADASREITIT